MPNPITDGWSLSYEDPRSSNKLLVSLPPDMHRDLRLLAASRNVSVSELVRRMATREVAEYVQANPAHAKSFKGVAHEF